MKKDRKGISIFVVMIALLLFSSGCAKEEKQFDFTNVTAVRIYQGDDTHYIEIKEPEKVQELMKQVSGIVWQERKNSQTSIHNDDWQYRLQCFNQKGEKKQNIYLNTTSTIGYKTRLWDAEDEAVLDFSVYEEYFATQPQ